VVLVTNVAGTTWTVERGFDNTTNVAHDSGKEIRAVTTADDLDRTWLHLPLAGGTLTGQLILDSGSNSLRLNDADTGSAYASFYDDSVGLKGYIGWTGVMAVASSDANLYIRALNTGSAPQTIYVEADDNSGVLRSRITVQGDGAITFYDNTASAVATIEAGGITSGVPGFITFGVDGTLTSGAGTQRWYAPYDLTITRATLALGTASSSGVVTVDVNRSGTTIYTTQSNRPECAASSNFDASGTPDVTAMTKDTHYLTIDWDAIGTGAADATVTVEFVSA
jgi:hypothetical protein